jgi:hypothetical protein
MRERLVYGWERDVVRVGSKTGKAANGCGAELLAGLNTSLHGMSQPLTALLCMMEYGKGLETSEEVKMVFAGGLEQCGRLAAEVRAMQKQVLYAAEREGAERAL